MLIRDNCLAVLYDEYMETYENIMVDQINNQLGSNKQLASAIPALGMTDVTAGKTVWQKDLFKCNQNPDPMRDILDEGAKDMRN